MAVSEYRPSAIYYPAFNAPKATAGRLRWLGGNVGFDFPISIDVADEFGNSFSMNLSELLARLDDFEGFRGPMTVAANLVDCCFCAYEYGLMTAEEKVIFETYVREKINVLDHLEAARRLVLGICGVAA